MGSPPATPTKAAQRSARPERLGPGFSRLWAAGASTNLADGTLTTALPLIAATLTHDPLAVAGLTAARFLPWLLLGPFSGVLLDRVDRLRAMVVSNTVAAVAVALLAVVIATGHVSIWLLYAVLFVVISCETVTDPATRITVTRVVPGRLLDRANSRLEAARLVAQDFVAKPVAGVLFAVAAVLPVAGAGLSYALCAILVVTVIAILRRTPGLAPGLGTQPDPEPESHTTGDGLLGSLREGIGYILGSWLMRSLMLTNAGMMIGVQMSTAVMVLYVQQVLGVEAVFFGFFMASIAIGGVLGSLCVSRLITAVSRKVVMMGGYAGMGVCLIAMSAAPNAYIAAVALTLLGLCMTVSNIAGSLLSQTVVPDHLRGRFSAVYRTVAWGLAPIGALMGGLLGRIDLALPYLVGGLFMVGVTITFRKAIAECARLSDESVADLAATAPEARSG